MRPPTQGGPMDAVGGVGASGGPRRVYPECARRGVEVAAGSQALSGCASRVRHRHMRE